MTFLRPTVDTPSTVLALHAFFRNHVMFEAEILEIFGLEECYGQVRRSSWVSTKR